MGHKPIAILLSAFVLLPAAACHRAAVHEPPPDVRRPVVRSEEQLRAERAKKIESGQIVATHSPEIRTADKPTAPPRVRLPAPITPTEDAIQADLLMVNDDVVTAPEVLFPLIDELREVRRSQTLAGFRERARQMISRETRRLIGALLVYQEAMAALPDEQRNRIDAVVDKQVDDVVAHRYGGSLARLQAELTERDLTMDQFKANLRRDLVVQQYTREKLLPQVRLRRAELWDYYQSHLDEYSRPETRELLLMEFPFQAYLPSGTRWAQASGTERARAKLQAMQAAREAHEALAERPWNDVSAEFSKGPRAATGGSWGQIAKPLRAPFDELSSRIFSFDEGQYSEPVELVDGWYIVECGAIEPAVKPSFVEKQPEIRDALMDERYAALSTKYILRLAETATISSFNAFVDAAVRRAERVTDDASGSGASAARD